MKADEVVYQIKTSDPAHTFILVSKVSHSFFPSEIWKMLGFFLQSSFVIRECLNMTYLALHEKSLRVSASNFKMLFIHASIHSSNIFLLNIFYIQALYIVVITWSSYSGHHLLCSKYLNNS